MISMTIYKCDRCGKHYEEKNYASEYTISNRTCYGIIGLLFLGSW